METKFSKLRKELSKNKIQSYTLQNLGKKNEGTYFFHSFISHTGNGVSIEQWLLGILKSLLFSTETRTGHGLAP